MNPVLLFGADPDLEVRQSHDRLVQLLDLGDGELRPVQVGAVSPPADEALAEEGRVDDPEDRLTADHERERYRTERAVRSIGRKPNLGPGESPDARHAGGRENRRTMTDSTITLTLSKADAEVLLGVLASERHNTDAEAVCEAVRAQLDEKLAEAG